MSKGVTCLREFLMNDYKESPGYFLWHTRQTSLTLVILFDGLIFNYHCGPAVIMPPSCLCMSLLLSINVSDLTALLSISTSLAMPACLFHLSGSFPLSQPLLLCSDAVNRPLAWLQILPPNRHKSSLEREASRTMCCIIKRAVLPKGMMERSKRAGETTEREIPIQKYSIVGDHHWWNMLWITGKQGTN